MYTPKHFRQEEWSEIENLIRENSFATLVTADANGLPHATHLPLLLLEKADRSKYLSGHISRANPQWKQFDEARQVLAIFIGPHTYISPSWYNHKNVPTWNYLAVHIYGKVKLVEGDALRNAMQHMMHHYEHLHAKQPLTMNDVPDDLLRKDLAGIKVFEISLDEVLATWKLSQNRDAESFQNVINELEQSDAYNSKRVANEMTKIKKR